MKCYLCGNEVTRMLIQTSTEINTVTGRVSETITHVMCMMDKKTEAGHMEICGFWLQSAR